MKTIVRATLLALGLFTVFASGCAEPIADINRVQPDYYEKDIFKGEWYYARTIVDVPFESQTGFIGDRLEWNVDSEDYPAHKIRWLFRKGALQACRADEIVIGGNSDGRGDELDAQKDEQRWRNDLPEDHPEYRNFKCEHPVAFFKIDEFDILRSYNSATGEQSNVIAENRTDRPWNERDYVRFFWNPTVYTPTSDPFWFGPAFGGGAPYDIGFISENDDDCSVSNADGTKDYSRCDEGRLPPRFEDTDGDGEIDSINVTATATFSPDFGRWGSPLYGCYINAIYGSGGGTCTASQIAIRLSFRKVKPKAPTAEYEPLYYPDEVWERFGMWRVKKNTYVPGRGQTDFKQALATRWPIWQQTSTCPVTIVNGQEVPSDPADCTPLPLAEREVNPIVYYLNRSFPKDLKSAAFEVAKRWNDAFDGIPHAHGEGESELFSESCRVVCGSGSNERDADDCGPDDAWRMTGTCAFVLKENDGNKFLGDLRYSYIAYIEDPGQAQPCGVGGPANDPETGEMINGVSYVYGAGCFDYINTRVEDMVDILCAQKGQDDPDAELPASCQGIDENQYLQGLNVLEIMQAQGYTQSPRTPIRAIGGTNHANSEDGSDESGQGEAMSDRMREMKAQFEELEHHGGWIHNRHREAKELGLTRSIIPDEMAQELSAGRAQTAAELTDDELGMVDLLNPFTDRLAQYNKFIDDYARRAIEPAEYLFNDRGLWHFVEQHMDLDREALRQLIRENAFKAVTLHELGHNMGLRHNFIASFDRGSYFPEYWDLKEEAARIFTDRFGRSVPEFDTYYDEDDETEEEFADRYLTWADDREELRKIEQELGVRDVKYSSIMDYHGSLYADWHGLGDYDKAAMRFLYAGLVDRTECQGTKPEDCLSKGDGDVRELHERAYVPWYSGGELCQSDEDCPMAAAGQKCRPHQDLAAKFCSNWDADENSSGRYNPRQQFCSDERVADKPFCNRFDEGESSEEIVRHAIESYHQGFVFNNFRRYRASFRTWSYYSRIWSRYFSVIGNQMQSLLYKYYYETGFRSNNGPGGFDDMVRATIVGFEFLGNVLAIPRAGAYEWEEDDQVYRFIDRDLVDESITGRDLINLPLGMGKTLYSSYEDGYFGEIRRLSYVGAFYDKLRAVQALTARDWGASTLGNDERFYLSFYDFFPQAYLNLVGNFISGNGDKAGLVFNPNTGILKQRTFWDGTFLDDDVAFSDDIINPEGRKVRPGASVFLNNYTMIYAILDTPVYFDLSFMSSVRAFEVGGVTGFDLDHLTPDDYVDCISPLTGRRFAAVRTDLRDSIAIQTIDRCQNIADEYNTFDGLIQAYEDDPLTTFPDGMTLSEARQRHRRLRSQLTSQEDVLSNLVYMVDRIGIGSL